MAFVNTGSVSPRMRLLTAAINAVNQETKIGVLVCEKTLEVLIKLVQEQYPGVDSLDSLFAHPDVSDDIKTAIQATYNELQDIKQARYALSEELNRMINDTRAEENNWHINQ